MDTSCLTALVLVVTSEVLEFIATSRYLRFFNSECSFDSIVELNPECIKQRFMENTEDLELYGFATMIGALAIFAFYVPILQVSWILSDGGKRRVGSLALVLVLALTGGMCELIVSLMLVGIRSVAIGWIGSDTYFNLDDWLGEDSGDMIGWRVLELTLTILNGEIYLIVHMLWKKFY